MIVECEKCGRRYDDARRWTLCPHPHLGEPPPSDSECIVVDETSPPISPAAVRRFLGTSAEDAKLAYSGLACASIMLTIVGAFNLAGAVAATLIAVNSPLDRAIIAGKSAIEMLIGGALLIGAGSALAALRDIARRVAS